MSQVALMPTRDYVAMAPTALPRGPRTVALAASEAFQWDVQVSLIGGVQVIAIRFTSWANYTVDCPNGCEADYRHMHVGRHRAWVVYRDGKFHGGQFMRAGDIARNVKVGELKALLSNPGSAARAA